MLGVDRELGGGIVSVHGEEAGRMAAGIFAGPNGGSMALFNEVIDMSILQAGISDNGEGYIMTFNKAGSPTNSMGPERFVGFKRVKRN